MWYLTSRLQYFYTYTNVTHGTKRRNTIWGKHQKPNFKVSSQLAASHFKHAFLIVRVELGQLEENIEHNSTRHSELWTHFYCLHIMVYFLHQKMHSYVTKFDLVKPIEFSCPDQTVLAWFILLVGIREVVYV